jgi:predicted nucleic acid-binding protein
MSTGKAKVTDPPHDSDGPLRAVLDTNVWVNIFLHKTVRDPKQPYAEIDEALKAREFVPVYCPETRDELEYMLKRGKNVGVKYNIRPELVDEFLGAIFYEADAGVFVEIAGNVFVSSDPDDDMFAEAAVAGRAQFLVTEDPHLHEHSVKQYLCPHGIRVVWPNQFRQALRGLRAS